MRLVDDRVLELLADSGAPMGPSEASDELAERGAGLEFSAGYLGERLRALAELGLVDQYGTARRPIYQIATNGEEYLAGDLDAELLAD
jgi:repressor of nif and glnA expression